MSACIWSPFYPISSHLDVSHRSGWAQYWQLQLHDEPDIITRDNAASVIAFSRIYLYHGMEFKGALNLQSGLTDEVMASVRALLKIPADKLVSLDVPCPDYGKLLGARAARERPDEPAETWAKLTKHCRKIMTLAWPRGSRNLVVGDSHSLSLAWPETTIVRHDGLTMHGALARGLISEEAMPQAAVPKQVKRLTVYLGNIDVRHHLCRQPNAKEAVKKLLSDYEFQVKELAASVRAKEVELVELLPIEDESRVLPKSGYYQGTPFFGSWQQRHDVKKFMNLKLSELADKHGWHFYRHAFLPVDAKGKLSFDAMEKPRSVHVRPSLYRYASARSLSTKVVV